MTVSRSHRLTKTSSALVDILQRWRHPVYSGHPKVLTSMLAKLCIQNGDSVLECGTGNGVGTALLSRAVGPKGKVCSIDKLDKSIQTVEARLKKLQDVYSKLQGTELPKNVMLVNTSIQELQSTSNEPQKTFDMIFVDIGDPASNLKLLSDKVRPGKCLAVYIPSVHRIVELLETIKGKSLPLVLEGVWEESLSVITVQKFHESSNCDQSSENLSSNRQASEVLTRESEYQLHVPYKDEMTTSFLAKFRRLLTDNDNVPIEKPEFTYGDHIMFSTKDQPKKGKHRTVIVKLSPGLKFYNDWGSVNLDDIVSMSPGSLIQTSIGQSLYLTHPTFTEFVCHHFGNRITQQLAFFSPRFHHLLGLSANVCHGRHVLEISAMGTSLTQHLCDTVGGEGHVYSVINDIQMIEKLSVAWQQGRNQRGNREFCGNQTILRTDDLPGLRNSAVAINAVILMPKTSGDVGDYISSAIDLLKPGKLISVLCTSLAHVSRVLQHNAVRHGELEPKIVYEDQDRPWIVKPPTVHNKNDTDSCYYICRPKHGETCPIGYVVVLIRR